MKLLFTFYLWWGGEADHRRLPFEIPLARRHQRVPRAAGVTGGDTEITVKMSRRYLHSYRKEGD